MLPKMLAVGLLCTLGKIAIRLWVCQAIHKFFGCNFIKRRALGPHGSGDFKHHITVSFEELS